MEETQAKPKKAESRKLDITSQKLKKATALPTKTESWSWNHHRSAKARNNTVSLKKIKYRIWKCLYQHKIINLNVQKLKHLRRRRAACIHIRKHKTEKFVGNRFHAKLKTVVNLDDDDETSNHRIWGL